MDAGCVGALVAADLKIRNARIEDVDAMASLRGPRALHDDRVWGAMEDCWRVLVACDSTEQVVGWETVVFEPQRCERALPMVIDLFVAPWARCCGVGTRLIEAAERVAARRGFAAMHLSVDPAGNSRALALYQRLGYRQVQEEPYFHEYRFEDSGGNVHVGKGWAVDLRKGLAVTVSERSALVIPKGAVAT